MTHTHIDHVMDSALVADRTGAQLVGGESAANVGRGYGLPEDRLVVAAPATPVLDRLEDLVELPQRYRRGQR